MRKTQWQLLNEFSESAIQKIVKKFSNESDEQTIRSYLKNFEKYKNGIQKKDPFQYTSFMEFEQAVDAAKGKSEFKKRNLADKGKPKEFVNKQEESSEAIADDEDVTIFKGDEEHKCVKYGKGYSFCISRPLGGNMFGSYRLQKASTFYFVFFKKVPKSDPKHIMVLDRTDNGWEWTFADNDTVQIPGGFGEVVKNFPVLEKYKKLFENIPLSDKEREILEIIKRFNKKQSLEIFQNVDYETKVQLIKSGIKLNDDIFKTLDKNLRNDYISVGGNVTTYQADNLSDSEISRYRNVRKLTIPQLLEAKIYRPSKLDIGLSDSVDVTINNGQLSVKYEDLKGSKVQKDYDTNGNMIHMYSRGREMWKDYDENNNLIHYKDSSGYDEYWKEYDENNNLIHYKDSSGNEWWKEYDENNNLIYYKDSSGYELWKEYDENNKMIHYKDSSGYEWYDENGNKIPNPNLKNESLNNNMITQRDLLTEGFWKALGKGIAKTADYVVPELTRPIRSTVDAVKDIGSSIKQGWTGEQPTRSSSSRSQDPRSSSSQSQAPYQYGGKYYSPDYSKQAVKKGSDWEIPGYQVDDSNSRISNSQIIIIVDQNGVVKNVR
jgi:YD repeat-containing protein